MGPDMNVLMYCFNFYTSSGQLNTDLGAMNEFNTFVLSKLSISKPGFDLTTMPLVLSRTKIDSKRHGKKLAQSFTQRCGITLQEHEHKSASIVCMRSTVMDPYLSPKHWDKLNAIVNNLGTATLEALEAFPITDKFKTETTELNTETAELKHETAELETETAELKTETAALEALDVFPITDKFQETLLGNHGRSWVATSCRVVSQYLLMPNADQFQIDNK
jgi:hypothetical protein